LIAMMINDDCINCGACLVECPAEAIYETTKNYEVADKYYNSISNEHFYIVTELCDECVGFNKTKCVLVCPMNAIKKTNNYRR